MRIGGEWSILECSPVGRSLDAPPSCHCKCGLGSLPLQIFRGRRAKQYGECDLERVHTPAHVEASALAEASFNRRPLRWHGENNRHREGLVPPPPLNDPAATRRS